MKFKILLSEKIHEKGMQILQDFADLQIADDPSEETIIKSITDADAFVVRSSKVTARMIEAGGRLKVIGRHGIGVDNIDMDAANRQGVVVVNTPEANVISVSEYAVAAMLKLCKRLEQADLALRTGEFDQPGSLPGLVTKLGYTNMELYGKTLGVIGVGKIARRVANICKAGFDMKVCGYDAFIPAEAIKNAGIEPCNTVEEVLSQADFVSVHVPLTPGTKNLLDLAMMKKMKPTAFLINSARGGVVNEEDLYQALEQGIIAGAAIDVFMTEPPGKNHPLFTLKNILVTPHMAAMTDGALYRMAMDVANGVIEVLEGKEAKYWVNKKEMS